MSQPTKTLSPDGSPQSGATERPGLEKAAGDVLALARRLEYALDLHEVGVWELDLLTGVSWRSSQFDRIFGYPELFSAWTYTAFLEQVLTEDTAAVDASFRRAIAQGCEWHAECRIRRPDGAVRWIAIEGTPQRSVQGGMTRLLGVVRDITLQKQALAQLAEVRDAAEAVSRADNELLSEIGHRLRSSLDSILGAFGRLTQQAKTERGKAEALATIQPDGQALLALLSRFSDLVQTESAIQVPGAGDGLSTFLRSRPSNLPEGPARTDARREGLTAAGAALRSGSGRLRRARVLLVDDVPSIRSVIIALLKPFGLDVDEADDGEKACEMAIRMLAEGRPYDLILMDLVLPKMNGMAAVRRLRQGGWRGPIIALTAHAVEGDRERCLEAGCDDYVSKPVSGRELEQVVNRFLGGPLFASPSPIEPAD